MLVEKKEEIEEREKEDTDEFTSIDVTDILDGTPVFNQKDWVEYVERFLSDRKKIKNPDFRRKSLKSIIKNGVPFEL